jgi:ubiquinone/menaquinone biosynthesis C-methylase UbiE
MAETPATPSLQQLPSTWDVVAPTYAEDAAQWQAYAEEAARLVPVATSNRVLDVACGSGTLSFLLAPRVARVDAVDFSPGMVEEVVRRASREGVDNVHAAVMDAQSLAFPDGSFDAAFCLFAFFFLPDRARAFRELLRVLRPGGRALVATWGPIETRPLMKIAFDAMAEALPQAPRPSKGDLQDPDECVREMTQAGFRDVTAEVFSTTTHVVSAERYLDLIVRSAAPLAVMKHKLGEQAWVATRSRLLDAVQRRMPEHGADLAAEAILTHGMR